MKERFDSVAVGFDSVAVGFDSVAVGFNLIHKYSCVDLIEYMIN